MEIIIFWFCVWSGFHTPKLNSLIFFLFYFFSGELLVTGRTVVALLGSKLCRSPSLQLADTQQREKSLQ